LQFDQVSLTALRLVAAPALASRFSKAEASDQYDIRDLREMGTVFGVVAQGLIRPNVIHMICTTARLEGTDHRTSKVSHPMSCLRPVRSLAIALASLAVSLALAQYPGSEPAPEGLSVGFASIKSSECKEWLAYLAGKECAGRGSGQPGFQKAADFMAKHFKECGLKPMGDNGTYFQNVPFSRSRLNAEGSFFSVDGKDAVLKAEGNFGIGGINADADIRGEVLFVKVASDEATLDDVALDGRIVVVSGRKPGRNLRRQLFLAGVPAILTVDTAKPASNWNVRSGSRRMSNLSTLQGTITVAAAQKLATLAGVDGAIADPATPSGVAIDARPGATVRLVAKAEVESIGVPNVVGLLEGTDPILKGEYVGIGAHLDHLGTDPNGVVYWGADDDGSGSTSLIAICHAFAKNPSKPKRSVLFMAFCGEEMGLIGSSYLVNHPVVPLDKMVCELQMDMVGRNEQSDTEKPEDNIDTTHLVGSKRISTELHELILSANKHVNFKFEYDEENVYTRSDHYMFAQKGIPIAFVFSGFHPDYHQPTDTPDKINYEKLANTAKLYYLAASMAANLGHALKKDSVTIKSLATSSRSDWRSEPSSPSRRRGPSRSPIPR
jgi:hypothetical protein